MIAAEDIERMSVAERLQAMELLRKSISRNSESVPSPDWHEEVLAQRKAKADSDEAEFLTVGQLRKRLNRDS
jgi:hypothetical protein